MISVVCPVFNEAQYIEQVLSFFVNARPREKELYIIDGGSADETRSIVLSWAKRFPGIFLLDNPSKYVPFALNKAIPLCKGDIIVRLDAHTEYAGDYFEQVIKTFYDTDADIVGGPMRAKGFTAFQSAVAYCTSTTLGVGDSRFHDEHAEGYVDSVYLGAWRKSIFEKTGMFDEQMVRNQDDEFHYRAKSKGMKIYLNPAIRSYYFPRNHLKGLFRQYFQYGYYKPLVLQKVRSELKPRHIVPTLFVAYLVTLPLTLGLIGKSAWAPALIYVLAMAYYTAKFDAPLRARMQCFRIYPALHIAYGTGFLLGLFKRSRKKLD